MVAATIPATISTPFNNRKLLAKLDEKPNLIITDNMPILDGATALFPVYASFVEAVYSENEYRASKGLVLCRGTEAAYKNLFEGKTDIIFCAGPSEN